MLGSIILLYSACTLLKVKNIWLSELIKCICVASSCDGFEDANEIFTLAEHVWQTLRVLLYSVVAGPITARLCDGTGSVDRRYFSFM